MFKPNNYAFQIETTIRAIFHCDRYGLGGIADADFIEKEPFIAIAMVLGNFYNKIPVQTKNRLDKFFLDYYCEMGKSIEEIEEETIKNIIKEFNNIIATI